MVWDPNSKEEKQKRIAWQIAMESAIQNKAEFLDVYNRQIKSIFVDLTDESSET